MWYVFGVTLWIIIYFDTCQPQFNSRPGLYRRPKTYKPDQTVITSSPKTKTYYNPNPGYDAYWTDGHWIFGTTTTRPTHSTSTMTRPLVCRKPCGIEYRYVGLVCAQMVNNTDPYQTLSPRVVRYSSRVLTDPNKPFFYTFPTYCAFLNAQCSQVVWNYMSWVFVHFGDCLDDTVIYLPVEADTWIRDRMVKNRQQYKDDLNQSLDKNYNQHCHTYNMNYIDKTDLVGSCYRLIIDQGRMRWQAASNLCKADGAKLLVIDNEVEQTVVASILSEVDPTWTFFTDFIRESGGTYGVGNTQFTKYLFTKSDGETLHEVGYAPWEDNKRETGFDYWACIVVNASNGMYTESWMNENGNMRSFPFCEMMIPKLPPY